MARTRNGATAGVGEFVQTEMKVCVDNIMNG